MYRFPVCILLRSGSEMSIILRSYRDAAITGSINEFCGVKFSQLQACLSEGNPDPDYCQQQGVDYNECGLTV